MKEREKKENEKRRAEVDRNRKRGKKRDVVDEIANISKTKRKY